MSEIPSITRQSRGAAQFVVFHFVDDPPPEFLRPLGRSAIARANAVALFKLREHACGEGDDALGLVEPLAQHGKRIGLQAKFGHSVDVP